MEKLHIELPDDAWHGYSVESLWATELGSNVYRLENTPFFASGLAYQDEVSTRSTDHGLYVREVLHPSGASTYRIITNKGVPASQFQAYWRPIEDKGCSFEQGNFGFVLYAVHIPAGIDMQAVYGLLQNGEDDGIWDFEEGHCGQGIFDPDAQN